MALVVLHHVRARPRRGTLPANSGSLVVPNHASRRSQHARSRHRRHRPHTDRPGEQGIAGRLPARRPVRRSSSTRCSPRCPTSIPRIVEDVIWGCGQPAGEAGTNIGRVAGILAGIDVPGVTVNRYCSSSLQTIRMAAHAIKAGEGDVFIAGGVETVSRFQYGAADTGPPNEKFGDAHDRTKARDGRRPAVVDAARRSPRRLHRDGPDRGERASRSRRRRARRWTSSRCTSQRARGRRAGERLLRAGDHAGHHARRHGRDARTTAPARARPSRSSRRCKPVFRPDGEVTAGNACPLNDGAAAVS